MLKENKKEYCEILSEIEKNLESARERLRVENELDFFLSLGEIKDLCLEAEKVWIQ